MPHEALRYNEKDKLNLENDNRNQVDYIRGYISSAILKCQGSLRGTFFNISKGKVNEYESDKINEGDQCQKIVDLPICIKIYIDISYVGYLF